MNFFEWCGRLERDEAGAFIIPNTDLRVIDIGRETKQGGGVGLLERYPYLARYDLRFSAVLAAWGNK